jgi:hypothetical protein
MIALKTSLNGQQICLAGAEDLCVLNSIVNAVGKLGDVSHTRRDPNEPPDIFLSVGGLTGRVSADDEHLRWTEHQALTVGDEILITVVEVAKADLPTSRMSASSIIKDNDKKRYENAMNTFLELKDKYGDAFPACLEIEEAEQAVHGDAG